MTNKDVVFTAMLGNYESLNEIEVAKDSTCLFYCFTDNPELKSETWEILHISPAVPGDSARSSRAVKMLGHKDFPPDTRSLYIDNTVKLLADPTEILDSWLANGPLAFMEHTKRRSVRREFLACSAYGLDDPDVIYRQFQYYKEIYPEILDQKPFWGGMIARISNSVVDKFMDEWFFHNTKFSRRDQLAINASSHISGTRIATVDGVNDFSKWHQWPIITARDVASRQTIPNSRFRKGIIAANYVRFTPRFL